VEPARCRFRDAYPGPAHRLLVRVEELEGHRPKYHHTGPGRATIMAG
jgi:hypothetical protein